MWEVGWRPRNGDPPVVGGVAGQRAREKEKKIEREKEREGERKREEVHVHACQLVQREAERK